MPPFLRKVEEMLGGGVPRGYLCMWAAGTSSGKSTVINQALTWWVMNTKEVVGVLSLEATLGELSTNLLSSYTKTKFAAIRDPEEREKTSQDRLCSGCEGTLHERRWLTTILCDDRGSNRKEVEAKVEQMIAEMGITVLVVDVLSDILSGLSIAEQEEHMAWQKSIIKAYNVTIHNIVHQSIKLRVDLLGRIQRISFLVQARLQSLLALRLHWSAIKWQRISWKGTQSRCGC